MDYILDKFSIFIWALFTSTTALLSGCHQDSQEDMLLQDEYKFQWVYQILGGIG